ncbi:COMM domain-containing protein 10 [Diplonema papillatum]|nr:COMM domain-containing protein 10 [Diplonema papillatum]
MADETIFSVKTASLLSSVESLNGLSADRLTNFCSRILEHMTDADRDAAVFTEQEEKTLAKKLKREDVRHVVDAAMYIFEQFAYHSVAKDAVNDNLFGLGFSDDGAAAVAEAWSTSGKAYLAKVRSHSLGGPLVLTNVTYDSQLKVSDDVAGPVHEPNAILQLHLLETGATKNVAKEKVSIRFNHDQLYDFFKQIDSIQTQIDGIAGGN